MKQLDIFIAFFRSGILGYGGGPSSIPLVHREVVGRFRWMNDDDFSDILALANALPGPINTKMAGYIGYRVGGYLGMVTALLASVVPTVLIMVLLLTVLNAFKDEPWVQGMSQAVVPVVGVMLGTLTWDFIKKSQSALGWSVTLIFFVVVLVLLEFLGIHPAILILGVLLYALFSPVKKESSS